MWFENQWITVCDRLVIPSILFISRSFCALA